MNVKEVFRLKIDKKLTTAFVVTSLAIAGTALASYSTSVTTQRISIGSSPSLMVETSTVTAASTTPAVAIAPAAVVTPISTGTTIITPVSASAYTTVSAISPEALLANTIFTILGIPVTVQEITTLKTTQMGYGEITLAYSLANASGKSVDYILDLRFNHKMGWGKIAKTLGVKLHGAADRSVHILHESQLVTEADNFIITIKPDLDEDDEHDSGKQNKNQAKDNQKDDHGNHGKPAKKSPPKND